MSGPVSDYLKLFPSKATGKVYWSALLKFFDFLEGEASRARPRRAHTPEALAKMDAAAEVYLDEVKAGRSAGRDVVQFIAALQSEYSPATVTIARAAVVGFLEDNRVELSRLDEKQIKKRVPRPRIVTEEETVTKDHLRALVPLLSIRDRAVVLVMLASGGRIGEILQLRLQDVDLDAVPARVTFRAETTKNKQRRIAFLNGEAVDAVRVWLTGRADYITVAARRNLGLVSTGKSKPKRLDDNRLFPFSRASFDLGWERALERAGLLRKCETTGRLTIHPHGLRKYFRTHLGAAGGPDLAEVLMGHSGYLTAAYRRPTEQELADGYLKHCSALSVVEGGDLTRQVEEYRKENEDLRKQMADLEAEVRGLTVFQMVQKMREAQAETEGGA